MRSIVYTGQFRKDVKLMITQGANKMLFLEVLKNLQAGKPLDLKYEDYPLHGKMDGKRDCHITPDWVLIHAVDKNDLTLSHWNTFRPFLTQKDNPLKFRPPRL
jgi:mRNA interferase YafQ